MRSLKNFYAKPIEVQNIGNLYPLSVYEYVENIDLFGVLQITVKLYLQSIDDKDKELRKQVKNTISNFDVVNHSDIKNKDNLINLLKLSFKNDNIKFLKINDMRAYNETDKKYQYSILQIRNFFDINKDTDDIAVIDFYNQILNEPTLDKDYEFISVNNCSSIIDRNNYDYIRNQLIRINAIRLPKQAPTKELQEWYDKAYKFKNNNSNADYEDMLSTVAKAYHKLPDELEELTPYQLNVLYARDIKDKEFKASISYRCSPNFKDVKVTNHGEHIDICEDTKISSDFNSFRRKMTGMLSK